MIFGGCIIHFRSLYERAGALSLMSRVDQAAALIAITWKLMNEALRLLRSFSALLVQVCSAIRRC
jgi:hypothetical protein